MVAGKTTSDLGVGCVGDVKELPPAVPGACFYFAAHGGCRRPLPAAACRAVAPRMRFPHLAALSLALQLFLLIPVQWALLECPLLGEDWENTRCDV